MILHMLFFVIGVGLLGIVIADMYLGAKKTEALIAVGLSKLAYASWIGDVLLAVDSVGLMYSGVTGNTKLGVICVVVAVLLASLAYMLNVYFSNVPASDPNHPDNDDDYSDHDDTTEVP